MIRHLTRSLVVLQILTSVTLLRSVAFDRWITVAASILLLTGAIAARRGKTWGVALAAILGSTFATAWAVGIAPFWFAIVGAYGVIPFMRLSKSFAIFDKGAARVLAALVATLGVGAGFAWKAFAFDLFAAFPALDPSFNPHHGYWLLALLPALWLVNKRLVPKVKAEESQARIATGPDEEETHIRVADEELLGEEESLTTVGARARRIAH